MGHVFTNLLIAGGVSVISYDIDGSKVEVAANDGAPPASTIRDLSSCEIVLTSLPDDDAVRSVVLSSESRAFPDGGTVRPGSTVCYSQTPHLPRG
jgi:3-hydroxyisobutyrate dehydrogenase-like beta-hydroxyacid dehydrogenase